MKFYILLMMFVVEVLFGQLKEKQTLTVEDYDLWESYTSTAMSADGKWVYYGLEQKQNDTLFLQSTTFEKRLAFPNASGALFSPKSNWFAFNQDGSLHLLDLKTMQQQVIAKEVLTFDFSAVDSYLLIFLAQGDTTTLQLLNLKSMQSHFVYGITSYVVSPDKQRVAVSLATADLETVKVYTLQSILKEVVVATTSAATFTGLKWDFLGDKLAFFKETKTKIGTRNEVELYWSTGFDKTTICRKLVVSEHPNFPKRAMLSTYNLYLESSSDQLFFTIQKDVDSLLAVKKSQTAEVWSSNDLSIPPKGINDIFMLSLKWYLWDTAVNTIYAVEDDLYPQSIYMNSSTHALVYNADAPTSLQKNRSEAAAVFVKNLVSGRTQQLTDKLSNSEGSIFSSSTGKYIAYFMDKDWWVYDVYKDTHRCLTQGMALSWHQLDYDKPGNVLPCFEPSWTTNDDALIVYDRYDIWVFKPDGTSRKRLTNGSKTDKVYRIHSSYMKSSPNFYSSGYLTHTYNLTTNILLKTIDEVSLAEGFAVLHKSGKVQQLLERESVLNLISVASGSSAFFLVEENFCLPPQLLCISASGKQQIIHKSNAQQENYQWGKSNLIYYITPEGKHLKGALFYPENYDVDKKYPLVVSIYEKKSHEVFRYTAPSQFNTNGFNNSNYVTDGYFVLYPDVSYELNSPGESALSCVTAAVATVVTAYPIDESKIGIIGHSFGGYETAYIMGKSDLFATAVVGAPAIDLLSNYLTIDGHGQSNMWRYESDQMRMPAPFYSEEFSKNSPLNYVQNINAPILTWTGTKDLQLHWSNSVKFHSALWRLKKKSTLLVYPQEDHVLTVSKNQLDLTIRIKQWFDFYLKDKPLVDWMGE